MKEDDGAMEVLRIAHGNRRIILTHYKSNDSKGMAIFRAIARYEQLGEEPPPDELPPEEWAEIKEEQERALAAVKRRRDNGGKGGRPKHDSDFEEFWKLYPRQEKKLEARRAWEETKDVRPPLAEIIIKLQRQRQVWKEEQTEGRFIPYARTWLLGQRWDDEI